MAEQPRIDIKEYVKSVGLQNFTKVDDSQISIVDEEGGVYCPICGTELVREGGHISEETYNCLACNEEFEIRLYDTKFNQQVATNTTTQVWREVNGRFCLKPLI